MLSDERFMLQKGLRSLVDKDARVGSKSKTSQFYGYKAEFAMTTDERIITDADAHNRDICIGKNKSKARKLQVAASAPLFYELSQEQKQPEFQCCTGMEERRNETLPWNEPSQRLGTQRNTHTSKADCDRRKFETDRGTCACLET